MIRKIIKEDNYQHRHQGDVERLQRVMLQKDMNSICVLAFSLDSEGYKTIEKTKYLFDNRF